MAVKKNKTTNTTDKLSDAQRLVETAKALPTRKHAKKKTGFKKDSVAFLNQVAILGDKGMIYTTPDSGGNYYFRTWIAAEKKYFRKSLRTTNRTEAIQLGETEAIGIMSKIKTGHKVFGLSWDELCQDWLEFQGDRVSTNRITSGRLDTLKTQVNRWIIPYIGSREKVANLDRNSFYDYGMFRRKKTDNQVQDVTIRNEYTTINAIAKYAYRNAILPFEKFNVEEIRIREMPRRDTFTPEEYKVFYTKMRSWVDESVDGHEKYYRSLMQNFILLKSNTFCRFGELRLLKWNMVKIFRHEGEPLVELNLPAEICKNRKDRSLVARGGRYLERVKEITGRAEPEDYVFLHHKKRDVLKKPTFYKYWKELMDYTGMPDATGKQLTYYSLRHFGITARLMAKVPHYEVAKFAGTDIRHIETHYEHLDMTRMVESATKSFTIDENGFVVRD